MKFRTEIPLKKQESKIDYGSPVLLLGSCFVENIGKKLEYYKFRNLQNPFGILFHPQAIENFLRKVTSGYTYAEVDVFQHNERWHCFDAHSVLSDSGREALIDKLNLRLRQTADFLEKSQYVVVTLGTAWFYQNRDTHSAVANCHKLPQKHFSKKLSSVAEVKSDLQKIVAHLRSVKPELTVIFTVSPVRHLKDGFVENQASKSHLISALYDLLAHGEEKLHYFPSYEIMMDELRDYRFYAEDMIHPNSTAIDFIWQKFVDVYVAEGSYPVMQEVEKIRKGLSHKPFDETSVAHREFLENIHRRIDKLRERYAHINF